MKEVMRKLLYQLETVILNHLYLQRDMQFFGWTLILMKFCLVTDYVRWHQDCDEDEEDQDEGRVEGPRPGSPPIFHSGDLNEDDNLKNIWSTGFLLLCIMCAV